MKGPCWLNIKMPRECHSVLLEFCFFTLVAIFLELKGLSGNFSFILSLYFLVQNFLSNQSVGVKLK